MLLNIGGLLLNVSGVFVDVAEYTETGLHVVPAVIGVSVGLIEWIDELGVCLPGSATGLPLGKALKSVRGDFGGGLGGLSSIPDLFGIVILIGDIVGILDGMGVTTIGARPEGKSIDEARF